MEIEKTQPEAQVPEVKSETTSKPEEMVSKAEFDKLSNEIQMLKTAKMDELVSLLYNQAQNAPKPEIKKDPADAYMDGKFGRKNKNKGDK